MFQHSNTSKYKENKLLNNKEFNTLDNKHRQMVSQFTIMNNNKNNILLELDNINNNIKIMNENKNTLNNEELKKLTQLLNKKDELDAQYNIINLNYNEMDYYDNAGDLILNYYDIRYNNDIQTKNKESKNILEFLSNTKPNINEFKNNNKTLLFEKYCQRVNGIKINLDTGINRIKYCNECNIEKILDLSASAYICQYCGDCEDIILDEDRQIKDYSPYKRLNHFREWLNQFQAKQSPEIPEQVFIYIVKELNKNRVVDLSKLTKKNIKLILKKLEYNIYYEHTTYIINKLNNLPPPKITRDMEKLFISMFYKIQEPWEMYKQPERKNFLSYSYVLYKFCELLELDHLLDCFSLHKDPDKIMENDLIWKKICRSLNWEYISSFK